MDTNIPDADITRRFRKGLDNLGSALVETERFYILDNSGKHARLLVVGENGGIKYVSSKLPPWADDVIRTL